MMITIGGSDNCSSLSKLSSPELTTLDSTPDDPISEPEEGTVYELVSVSELAERGTVTVLVNPPDDKVMTVSLADEETSLSSKADDKISDPEAEAEEADSDSDSDSDPGTVKELENPSEDHVLGDKLSNSELSVPDQTDEDDDGYSLELADSVALEFQSSELLLVSSLEEYTDSELAVGVVTVRTVVVWAVWVTYEVVRSSSGTPGYRFGGGAIGAVSIGGAIVAGELDSSKTEVLAIALAIALELKTLLDSKTALRDSAAELELELKAEASSLLSTEGGAGAIVTGELDSEATSETGEDAEKAETVKGNEDSEPGAKVTADPVFGE
ncbi:hypothetical protein Cantr_04591 [Candida viswanathii]|uniref:Uncharacterized protein n=1 Tax=Candida viswanathii TaxID=5486 RepID=A0A367XPD7_9ASCO|nr:hypothetical protein Cantr_04591 [Candida viswanathii]